MTRSPRTDGEPERDPCSKQVKHAVEQIWNVKVTNVRTMIRKGKPRRYRMHAFTTTAIKRAIVTLKEGDKIEIV